MDDIRREKTLEQALLITQNHTQKISGKEGAQNSGVVKAPCKQGFR